MMRHVEVYGSINMTCTTIPHLSMISRSGSMKHGHVKNLINGELPPCIFCRKPSQTSSSDGSNAGPAAWSRHQSCVCGESTNGSSKFIRIDII